MSYISSPLSILSSPSSLQPAAASEDAYVGPGSESMLQALDITWFTESDGAIGTPQQMADYMHTIQIFIEHRIITPRLTTEELEALVKLLTHSKEMYKIAEIGCWYLKGTTSAWKVGGLMSTVLERTQHCRPLKKRFPQNIHPDSVNRTVSYMYGSYLKGYFASIDATPAASEIPIQDQITAQINKIAGIKIPAFDGTQPQIFNPLMTKKAFSVSVAAGTGTVLPLRTAAVGRVLPERSSLVYSSSGIYTGPRPKVPMHPSAARRLSPTVTATGLQNYGNTCYANASFQALAQSRALVDSLAALLINAALAQEARHVGNLLVALDHRAINPQLAHDSLRGFMVWLGQKDNMPEKEMRKAVFRPSAHQRDISDFIQFLENDILVNMLNTHIHLKTKERLECKDCHYTRQGPTLTYPVYAIPLPETPGTHDLKALIALSQAKSDVEYDCDNLGCNGTVVESMTVFEACADVLIQIRRAQKALANQTIPHKRDDIVLLPSSVFNLNAEGTIPMWVYIAAVIHHIGASAGTGHYYTYVRTSDPSAAAQEWFQCNDGSHSGPHDFNRVNTKDAVAIVCRKAPADLVPIDEDSEMEL